MTCVLVRRRLSDWLDGALEPRLARGLESHLAECRACARRARELQMVGRLLSELPRLESRESVAAGVFDQIEIEIETRRPALASLFRGFSAARPFILPSMVPAALVLVSVLSGLLALDPGPLPEVHPAGAAWWATPASGTESNPLFPSAGVDLPRERTVVELPAEVLKHQGEGTFFLETVVARDGSVAGVTVIDGDTAGQSALVDALRRQRFEPVQYRGRPVAVSVYRLISRMEVRSPLT
jgi:hypothetical protein